MADNVPEIYSSFVIPDLQVEDIGEGNQSHLGHQGQGSL